MVMITYAVLATQVYSLFAGNPLWSNVIIVIYMAIVIVGIRIRRYKIENIRMGSTKASGYEKAK